MTDTGPAAFHADTSPLVQRNAAWWAVYMIELVGERLLCPEWCRMQLLIPGTITSCADCIVQ